MNSDGVSALFVPKEKKLPKISHEKQRKSPHMPGSNNKNNNETDIVTLLTDAIGNKYRNSMILYDFS